MKTYRIDQNIMMYRYGKPLETGAVVLKGTEVRLEKTRSFEIYDKEQLKLTYRMDTKDIVLGLGENLRGMNKRGGAYESYCTDDPQHTPGKKSLYGAHNFFIVDGYEKFGVFIDFPGRIHFDIGFTHKDWMDIEICGRDADVYIIEGADARTIVRRFLKLIGNSYVPPKWAFGYQQSRWSYPDAAVIESVADSFIENDIPCDTIYMDIDYMEDFKDFTVNKEKFPELGVFSEKLRDKGFRLIPIIDAGVKVEEGYEVYEEGVEKGFFCMDKEGKPFTGAVWPGRCHFPDFLKPEARAWFGLKYKDLIDQGIEGFWNDMNEPALFYTDRGLRQAIDKVRESENENLNIYSFFGLKDAFINLSNNPEDYKSFYHNINGTLVNHDEVHNLYGYMMTRAAAEGFEKIVPDKRLLLFSRASSIGMHRYGGIWTGDNHSWWEHLLINLKMLPSLNMCGFLYCGADTGGFSGDVNAELFIRWTQLSMFTPLFRNHSSYGTRNQEPYSFDEDTVETARNIIKLRYALIPYIYSEYMKAANNSDVYCSPLSFEYSDDMSRHVEDQVLVGDSIMIAPVYTENALGRYVWLPEDMLLWRASCEGKRHCEVIRKGHSFVELKLNETPIFIKKNKMLSMGKSGKNVESIDGSELNVLAFVDDRTVYKLYDDDGATMAYKKGGYSELAIQIIKQNDDYVIEIDNKGNETVRKINFEIYDSKGQLTKKAVTL